MEDPEIDLTRDSLLSSESPDRFIFLGNSRFSLSYNGIFNGIRPRPLSYSEMYLYCDRCGNELNVLNKVYSLCNSCDVALGHSVEIDKNVTHEKIFNIKKKD